MDDGSTPDNCITRTMHPENAEPSAIPSARPVGLSAFVRCRNEEEYITASLMSIYRVCDEIVVALNRSTDRTTAIVNDLARDHEKIRVLDYPFDCSAIGPGYAERALALPSSSLARFYNWCTEATTFSHVCKWDGDMIATPVFEAVKSHLAREDVVAFDGYDVLGLQTTDDEPRIFKYDPSRARYVDWDLYEVLQHDYSSVRSLDTKCYLHMKLVKRDWLGKPWVNPNLAAVRSVPPTGSAEQPRPRRLRQSLGRLRRVFGDTA